MAIWWTRLVLNGDLVYGGSADESLEWCTRLVNGLTAYEEQHAAKATLYATNLNEKCNSGKHES
eukprot:5147485-Pleurochrysis_carterae.AAC.1